MKYTVGVRDKEVYRIGVYNKISYEEELNIVEIPIDFKKAENPCDNNWGEIRLYLQNTLGYKFKTVLTEESIKNTSCKIKNINSDTY